jgi:hypothetical protein
MNIGDIIGHLAFGLIAFSFLVKDIFWLRIMSIAASLFSIFKITLFPPFQCGLLFFGMVFL